MCPYVNITSPLKYINYENKWPVTTWNHILQLYVWSGLWAISSNFSLPKKQQEQTTHPEASLYLNTHLDCLLGQARHSKDRWSHYRTQYKDIVLLMRASKEQKKSNVVFVLSSSGPHCEASRTSCNVLMIFAHVCAQTCDHSAVIPLFREWSVGSFTWLCGDLVIPQAPCQWINPQPQEKKDLGNTYKAFVLPVSPQLRIIVSFRYWGPVICHPLSPKGGSVSPQVVCVHVCVSVPACMRWGWSTREALILI